MSWEASRSFLFLIRARGRHTGDEWTAVYIRSGRIPQEARSQALADFASDHDEKAVEYLFTTTEEISPIITL